MDDMERRIRLEKFLRFVQDCGVKDRAHYCARVFIFNVEDALVASGLCNEAELKIMKDLLCNR